MSSVTFGGIPNFVPSSQALGTGADAAGEGFSDVLKNAVNTVNSLNDNAAAQVSNVLQGGGGDINSVMIAVEKADVSFQLMMQVRNKIVNAYQDIEKMQF
jgi:flagellar hook-basal body complex protein FliE